MAVAELQEPNMRKSVPNPQIRAVAMAFAGAALAAVATMFIPVSILENITGSTGLSELIPAAGSPLGDTARALIAFGTGAMTLAILAFILLRQEVGGGAGAQALVPATEWAGEGDAPSFQDRLARIKLPQVTMPKMPWAKNDDDITELADLPRLRNGDSHPDAPPRRPLVASQDLPILDLAEMPEAIVETVAEGLAPAEIEAEPRAPAQPVAIETLTSLPDPRPMPVRNIEPTLAEMVAQLEAALAERQKQLAELEAVAERLAGSPQVIQRGGLEDHVQPTIERVAASEAVIDEPKRERPQLEVVPAASAKDDDIDSALAAALATLHRMNATGR
jgi:hypothetical protein